MCPVYSECYLWIQWEQSFQKISSTSQASERNLFLFPFLFLSFFFFQVPSSPLLRDSSVPNITHLCLGNLCNECIMLVHLKKC